MKFMPQDVFDVVVLEFSKCKLLRESEFQRVKLRLFDAYGASYEGDTLWLTQAEELTKEVIPLAKNVKGRTARQYLQLASQFRQQLDENMQKRSALRSIFGGSFFSKSHPRPASRKEIALGNIKTVLGRINNYVIHELKRT